MVLERSRTALWRLIDATAKSSSSLNTYPIPDFFGPAAMQLQTFSRARKILGIRILPRAPTLQTYLFWPIGVNQRRELAQYSSESRFILSSCMQRFSKIQHEVCGVELVKHFVDCDYFSKYQRKNTFSIFHNCPGISHKSFQKLSQM